MKQNPWFIIFLFLTEIRVLLLNEEHDYAILASLKMLSKHFQEVKTEYYIKCYVFWPVVLHILIWFKVWQMLSLPSKNKHEHKIKKCDYPSRLVLSNNKCIFCLPYSESISYYETQSTDIEHISTTLAKLWWGCGKICPGSLGKFCCGSYMTDSFFEVG